MVKIGQIRHILELLRRVPLAAPLLYSEK